MKKHPKYTHTHLYIYTHHKTHLWHNHTQIPKSATHTQTHTHTHTSALPGVCSQWSPLEGAVTWLTRRLSCHSNTFTRGAPVHCKIREREKERERDRGRARQRERDIGRERQREVLKSHLQYIPVYWFLNAQLLVWKSTPASTLTMVLPGKQDHSITVGNLRNAASANPFILTMSIEI